jgi:hypothetical protein
MIRTEQLDDGRIRHYSDRDMLIRQVETGALYEDAADVQPCRFTYEETDLPIEHEDVDAEELLNIIVGGEAT